MSSLVKISNKIDNILGSPGQKATQNQPKMTVSEGVNQREGTSKKKCQEFENFITLIPVFNNIFTANILGRWGKRRGFTPHAGVIISVTINV